MVQIGIHRADRQAFHVPLPRGGQRLVEVVDIEQQAPLGAGEQAEVQQMAVPAGLDPGARAGRSRQIAGHETGGTPKKREGGAQHAAIADGYQLRGRSRLDSSRVAMGSCRSASGFHSAWLLRGVASRRALPAAICSSRERNTGVPELV